MKTQEGDFGISTTIDSTEGKSCLAGTYYHVIALTSAWATQNNYFLLCVGKACLFIQLLDLLLQVRRTYNRYIQSV